MVVLLFRIGGKLKVNQLVRNTDIDTAILIEKEDYQARQWECEQLVKDGVLGENRDLSTSKWNTVILVTN
jgi:hypothetical protein